MKWHAIDARTLRDWPLPAVPHDADKEERGRVLVAGGSREIAGAVQLAAVAALRAGAGKLVIAAPRSVAPHMSQVVPEARVIAVEENDAGSLRARLPESLALTLQNTAVVLAGPGMMDPSGSVAFVSNLLDQCKHAPVVLDAGAMEIAREMPRFAQPVLLTPHAGEMAHLLGIAKEEVVAAPDGFALDAAHRWNAVVALKGATTWIATPDGRGWRHDGAEPGLATSGSGDVLAGLIAGFAARDVPLEQACAWGVVVHALAGRELARRLGPLGYLARELPDCVPALLKRWRAPTAT
jgi:ADP-dependent NAD(P)H-hydrate dehydratase